MITASDGTVYDYGDYDSIVQYPFGYGLSYTTFDWQLEDYQVDGQGGEVTATVKVTNTGDVAGKDCVLVDDLIDTAGTIAGACHVLQDAGAKSVTVVATHGVLSGPAIERLKNCGAREVVLTDTVPIPEEKRWDGLTVLSIAPLLASAIRAVFEDGSFAELFDTYPEHHGQGFLFA